MSGLEGMSFYHGEEMRLEPGIPELGTPIRMVIETWSLPLGSIAFHEDSEIRAITVIKETPGLFLEIGRVTWPTGAQQPMALVDFGEPIGKRWVSTDTFYILEGGSL